MKVEFLSTVAVIAPDPTLGSHLYVDGLGLPLHGNAGRYQHSEQIRGSKSFGIWPLAQAGRTVPQASIEFDVNGVEAVTESVEELERAGYELLHAPRTEPWGQTVARLQSPEGLIIGISYIPAFHDET